MIVLIVSSGSLVSAQPNNWEIRNFSTKDGLSSNHINCIAKDSRGFMWFGGNNGLNRFDGYNFIPLTFETGKLHPLSNTKVLSILEDSDSVLWIGTLRGLYRFDPREPLSAIKHYSYFDEGLNSESFTGQPVNFLYEDIHGLLWMSCIDMADWVNYGVRTFEKKTESFTYHRIDSTFSAQGTESATAFAFKIANDSRGDLWLGSSSGLCKYDYENGTFQSYIPYPGHENPIINGQGIFYEDQMGNFWTSSEVGAHLFDRESGSFGELIRLNTVLWCYGDHASIYSMGEDPEGNIWCIVNQSLFRLPPSLEGSLNTSHVEQWTYKFSDLGLNSFFNLFIENSNSVWFPAPGYGVHHVQIKRKNFNTILPNKGYHATVLGKYMINAVFEDEKADLWIAAADSGIIQMSKPYNNSKYHVVGPTEQINAINQDSAGNLWISSRFGVISKVNINDEDHPVFNHYYPDPDDPASISQRLEYIWKGATAFSSNLTEHLMIKDQNGTLWFNSGKGIHDRYDPQKDAFFHMDHRVPDHINNDTCVNSSFDEEIWFPTRQGLVRILTPYTVDEEFLIHPGTVIRYQHLADDSTSVSSSWIRSIHFSRIHKPGTIWVGTIGGGLNKMIITPVNGTNSSRIEFKSYTRKDGLCDNNVLGILEDESGSLWLSTSNGLSKFNPETEKFRTYLDVDGLPTNLFAWTEPCLGKSGRMYFPTEFGLLSFHPDSILDNPITPPVVITDIQLFSESIFPGDDSYLKSHISYTPSINLPYNQNFLSFEYAALNYEYPEKNQYRYMLEGVDDDWIRAGTRRFAEYTGLRHGHYIFRVTGSNNDGVWNEEGASLQIHIHPPPWLTWWAYACYAFILLGIIFWYRRFLLNRANLKTAIEVERIEKEKIRQMEQMKSRFFTSMSHEFRTPLTLILGPLDEQKKGKSGSVILERRVFNMMKKNARRLLELINQLLDIAKLETGQLPLRISRGLIEDYIRTIAGSFHSKAEGRNISYSLDIQDSEVISFFDPDKVEKILTNLISNAFKFTPDNGNITVKLRFLSDSDQDHPQFAIISVLDSGMGIPKEHLDHIFDRFYQVNDDSMSAEGGTGIGLSLVKELVTIHKGEVKVESEPDKGTVFHVKIPITREALSEAEFIPDHTIDGMIIESDDSTTRTEFKPGNKELSERLILVVEDNADLRSFIAGNLRNAYQIITAANGREGLEKAQENIPDLIISDIMMPLMDGIEMCRQLREDKRTCHIPVLMLTAKADRNSKLEGLKTGAQEYMIKPFDSEELQIRVRNMIESQTRLREKFMNDLLLRSGHKSSISSEDQLLQKILGILDEHIADSDYTMDRMAIDLNMSQRQLHRKVVAVTGFSPNILMKNFRLRKAAEILKNRDQNISQVMYSVGFNNPSYFARSFKQLFKVNPSEYIKNLHR